RFPGLVPDALPATKLVHEYRLVHKAGMTFQGETGSWLLKGELVQTTYQKDVLNQNPQNPKFVKPSYFAYTTGFEYTFYSLLVDNHDLGTIVELIGDTDTGIDPAELEGFRPFQNHLFFGLRYTFNNISDRSFLLGGFYDYKEGDTIIQFEYNERLFENLTVKIQYSQLDLTAGQLSTFTNNDRLTAEFGFNF
ncbi:MAG: hypothetical protein KDD94_09515, partial [Calditrichaeota bacterium]|nr:hypothetical protein [Calditrichota bacterium]